MRRQERLSVYDFARATVETQLRIPFFQSLVQAGFPSPAENYVERVCDLNDLCISNAEATYFVRVASDSMIGDRIDRDDVLVVDCSREPVDGKIVVVWLNGDHVVKRIHYAGELIVLMSSNPKYDPIYVHPGDDFRVFGVVTFVIQKPV
ncbi:DNA polymerase V [Spirosoma lacussanchae]|uniref:LexA family protein n=1 Tax=Spirosoma lacussanchae TaxID=1884249 RepID=UPI001FE38627|nr:translesion error-prone DNA polymerase V autoproteolytic subunit [Spirosoma lacussanchae]